MFKDEEKVKSPCKNICEIDPATKLCRGCLRSIDEIAEWSNFTEADKKMVERAIKKRRLLIESVPEDELPELQYIC